MAPIPNPRVYLAKFPETAPVAGEHLKYDDSRTIDLDTVPLNGGFLTRNLLLSPEPYMRARMRDPKLRSYGSPMPLGAPVVGMGLVRVLRSEKPEVPVGSLMFGYTQWEAYTVQPYTESRSMQPESWAEGTFDMDSLALQIVPDPQGAFPTSRYCSVLGIPGLSAYVSFESMSEGKEGETCFVSSGASGVGSMVIQLAKRRGMKVIASASSDKKVEYMKSLGADVAFNYKKDSYESQLAEHGPIDVYYDNVGGAVLEHALSNMRTFGRLIICGQVSEYNVPFEKRYGIKNTVLFFERRLTMKGFLVPDLVPKWGAAFYADMPKWLAEGAVKSEEMLVHGLENAAKTFENIYAGAGDDALGKPVVVVATE